VPQSPGSRGSQSIPVRVLCCPVWPPCPHGNALALPQRHPWLAPSSAAFVFPAFVSRSASALAAGQAGHPFQSSLCVIGESWSEMYATSPGREHGVSLLSVFPPAKAQSLGGAGRGPADSRAPAQSPGHSCRVSTGRSKERGGHFLPLSHDLGVSEIFSPSQTCGLQSSPVRRAQPQMDSRNGKAEIPVPAQGKKLLGAKEGPEARTLPPAHGSFPPAAPALPRQAGLTAACRRV